MVGDAYTHRSDDVTKDIDDKVTCVDDCCLFKESLAESFFHVCKYLSTCGQHGMVFNAKKFIFAQKEVEFIGFKVTMDRVLPCDKLLEMITNYPVKKTVAQARGYFGLVQQGNYATSIQEHMKPFRDLLKANATFTWTNELKKLFEESRLSLVKSIERGVQIFQKDRPTCLCTDYSHEGMDFILLQKHCECTGEFKPLCCKGGWLLVLAGGCFTRINERKYSPVEGEALSCVTALHKAKYFVLGCKDLILAVDHQPLLKLFGTRRYEEIANPRFLNLKEKIQMFEFKIIHSPGRLMVAADGISRRQRPSNVQDTEIDNEVCLISCKESRLALSSVFWVSSDDSSMDNIDCDKELNMSAVSDQWEFMQ